jgi:predicted PurR-regulated permease PerM
MLVFAGVVGGVLACGLIAILIAPVVLALEVALLSAWTGGDRKNPDERSSITAGWAVRQP